MRWPPNKAWTSTQRREGYRHFELKQFGGKGTERWVELFAVNRKELLIRVSLDELKNHFKWTSGWLQLPKDEDCNQGKANVNSFPNSEIRNH